MTNNKKNLAARFWCLEIPWTLLLLLLLFTAPRLAAQTATNCTIEGLLAQLARTNYIFLDCSLTASNAIVIPNPIVISNDVTFEGRTNTSVFLSGNNASRMFNVLPGGTLTLLNLTLTAGNGARGGAINNSGIVFATNCNFTANKAAGPSGTNGVAGEDDYPNGHDGGSGVDGISGLGGAIWSNGELYLRRCKFANNSATGGNGGAGGEGGDAINNGFDSGDGGNGGTGAVGRGGAIFTASFAEVTECVFENNTATGGNGGAFGAAGTAGIPGEPGRGGQGAIASGGAIHNTWSLIVRRSTFSDNRAEGGDSAANAGQDLGEGENGLAGGEAWGGAICNINNANVVNSTFSTNRVVGGDGGKGADAELEGGRGGHGGSAYGGGFYNSGFGTLVNCTFAGGFTRGGTNGVGGTGATAGDSGNLGATRGGNLAGVSGELYLKNSIVARPGSGGNGWGVIFDDGFNLSSDATIVLDSGTGFPNTNPKMGHLADNDGFGRTFALASHSPCVDAASGDAPPVDQRGFYIFGDWRDIGAYEFSASQIKVHVANAGGTPIPGVQIVVAGQTNLTNGDGEAFVPPLPAGEYEIVPSHALYSFEPPSETVILGPPVTVNFLAVRTYSIAGFVRDGTNPVNNVTVSAGDGQATTGTNGFYRISGLDAGSYTVEPSSPGYGFVPSLQQINLQSDTTNVNFSAVGLLSVSGRIRTEAGQGLAGVLVSAGNRSAVTAPTGDYTITELPSRPQVVTPSLTGYSFIPASLNVTPTTDENGIDFSAFTSFQVSGVVLHSSNNLGANAVTITLRTNASQSGPPAPGSSTTALTGTNGLFSFANLRSGPYWVIPSRTGHGFVPGTTNFNLGPNMTNLVFRMFPAFTMSGRVTAAGVGLTNATIVLRSNNTQLATTTTTPTGTYSFDSYPRGTYVITPQAEGYQFTPINRTVTLTSNSNNLDFTSSGVFSIRGTVTKDGVPLPNVTVRTSGTVTITDGNGDYALTNLAPGAYTVTAEDPRYSMQPANANVSVGPDKTDIDFQALEVYAINGEVLEGAFPLAGVRVSASGVTNSTASNGRYTLSRVPKGSNVIVSVALPGYEFTPPEQSLVLDSIKNNVNFTARGLSAIAGRVIDAVTSNGISSVKITVSGRYETNTSPNGFYTLTNIGPGLLTVVPSRTNRGFTPILRQVNVLTNSITNNVDFVSFRASRLYGRIALEDDTNSGIANVAVRAEGTFGTNTVLTDANGNYNFPALRNGFYKLTPSRSGQGFDPAFYELDLVADTQRDFVGFPGFRIDGRIIDATTLLGIPGIQVNVNTPDIAFAATDTTGTFSFTGLREGDYTVTPVAVGYDMTPPGRQLSLGPTNASGVNFTARGNLTVAGRVLEGSAGVSNIQILLTSTNIPPFSRTINSGTNGAFVFTNLPPGLITLAPTLANTFSPSNYVLNPLNYQEPVFTANPPRLTIARATNGLRITLRGLPSRPYALETNSVVTGANWPEHRRFLFTDTAGFLEYSPPTNILSAPSLFFRARR